jgi:hypothetical protein
MCTVYDKSDTLEIAVFEKIDAGSGHVFVQNYHQWKFFQQLLITVSQHRLSTACLKTDWEQAVLENNCQQSVLPTTVNRLFSIQAKNSLFIACFSKLLWQSLVEHSVIMAKQTVRSLYGKQPVDNCWQNRLFLACMENSLLTVVGKTDCWQSVLENSCQQLLTKLSLIIILDEHMPWGKSSRWFILQQYSRVVGSVNSKQLSGVSRGERLRVSTNWLRSDMSPK